VSIIARTAWLALLTFTLIGIGCGQQDESHTNTGPETNANPNTPTPATESAAESSKMLPAAPQVTDIAPPPTEPAPVPADTAVEKKTEASEAAPAKPAAKDEGGVALEKVNFDTFLKRVAANPDKPKYTVVDAWATWCGPCKENFPHLVEMNRKYGDKGISFASVSFDDPSESKQVDDAKAFLIEKNATFHNYLLDEESGVGFEKFGINAIPAVFVYGPDGKEVKRFTMDDPNHQFTYDEVEKEVVALLDGKAAEVK
jgi:thiol-disulfide isomerase/thioredoxin